MRLVLVLALALMPFALRAEAVRDMGQPMVALAGFDKADLLGIWHEAARSESPLEVECHAVTTEFAARDDSRLTLKLACHKGAVDGPVLPVEGVLAETAPGLFQWRLVRLPQFGNIELAVLWMAEDRSAVVIGSARGLVGWVLTREADPDPSLVAAGIKVLTDNHYRAETILRAKE